MEAACIKIKYYFEYPNRVKLVVQILLQHFFYKEVKIWALQELRDKAELETWELGNKK